MMNKSSFDPFKKGKGQGAKAGETVASRAIGMKEKELQTIKIKAGL